ncbi:MAG: hypothetical protein FVQ80_00240 [Planctomycetes bacterium]|nr:hypothetical protein [Planctomycetota bacterium]
MKRKILFMQNKPNLKSAKMNLNHYSTNNYGNLHHTQIMKNKPISNPIKANQTHFNLSPLVPIARFSYKSMGMFRFINESMGNPNWWGEFKGCSILRGKKGVAKAENHAK